MIPTIQHNNKDYPLFQSQGFAAKYAMPFAQEVCNGYGLDIGCNRPEWAYKDKSGIPAIMVDLTIDNEYDAYNLPPTSYDYIFSSHCLEHLPNWVTALDYWATKLKKGGSLFLYLPHPSQSYWSPWHNLKHIHSFQPDMLRAYLTDRNWNKIFVSGCDLNNSFIVMAEKA